MQKPKVVFPYTEAGLGHIMPMNSIAVAFEKMYGDKVECVRVNFFKDSESPLLIDFERKMKKCVERYNKYTAWGFFVSFNMELWRCKLSLWGAVRYLKWGSAKDGIKFMEKLNPDLVISTHYATNYYAVRSQYKPLTAMYCPDAEISPLFQEKCDLMMTSMPTGYDKALKNKRRYNKDNLKRVPFLIREEAFNVSLDKIENRKKLGFDEDKLTVVVADGGYGIGRMKAVCKELLKRGLPITLVAVCGKNEELYNYFKTLKPCGETDFKPMGLVDDIFEILAAADVFCGKSGASMIAEPCFFGVPQIITKYSTGIEKAIGKYYINNVKSAIKIFNPKKVADKIEEFINNPELLIPYSKAAFAQRENYGAETCARYIFGLLCTRFPELKDGSELY